MTDIVDWPGLSGTKYRYWVLENPRNADRIQAVGGNYAFVKKLPNGNYIPIYFGVADSLRDRIPNHERLDDAIRAGATHVMTHTTPAGEAARIAEEGQGGLVVPSWSNTPATLNPPTILNECR